MAHWHHNKALRIAVKLIVPAAILAFLFHRLDVRSIGGTIARTNPLLFAVSFAVLCLRNVLGAYRSRVFLRHRGLVHSTASLARYYFIGNFFNLFLPEVVGRDLARGYYLYNNSREKSIAVSSIVAERFNGTAALFALSLVSVALATMAGLDVIRHDIVKAITLVFCFFAAGTVLLINGRTDRFLASLFERLGAPKLKQAVVFARDVLTYCTSPSLMAYTFLVSLVFQLVGVLATWLIALSLGETTPFAYYLIILPVIWVLGMLPVSINGLGIREGSFVVLFGAVGMAGETAMAISLLWFAQNIGLGIIGGGGAGVGKEGG